MRNKIKKWLRDYLFSNEKIEYEARLLALKTMRDNASIIALAREQLKGFDPKSITLDIANNRTSVSIYDGLNEDEQLELMNNIHQLHENPALRTIVDYLTRTQVLYGQMEADSLLSLNFSRATINGFCLIMDTINEVEGAYLATNRPKDNKFDPFDVV